MSANEKIIRSRFRAEPLKYKTVGECIWKTLESFDDNKVCLVCLNTFK